MNQFGVKNVTKESVDYLMQALKDKHEEFDANIKGENLCNISLDWDYDKNSYEIILPG